MIHLFYVEVNTHFSLNVEYKIAEKTIYFNLQIEIKKLFISHSYLFSIFPFSVGNSFYYFVWLIYFYWKYTPAATSGKLDGFSMDINLFYRLCRSTDQCVSKNLCLCFDDYSGEYRKVVNKSLKPNKCS